MRDTTVLKSQMRIGAAAKTFWQNRLNGKKQKTEEARVGLAGNATTYMNRCKCVLIHTAEIK